MAVADFPVTFLLDRVTANATTSVPFQVLSETEDLLFTFTSEGTTSGGTILLEESDLPSYTGTWSQITSQAASGFTGTTKLCAHVRLGVGAWVRARVSSAITGGGTATVTVAKSKAR